MDRKFREATRHLKEKRLEILKSIVSTPLTYEILPKYDYELGCVAFTGSTICESYEWKPIEDVCWERFSDEQLLEFLEELKEKK